MTAYQRMWQVIDETAGRVGWDRGPVESDEMVSVRLCDLVEVMQELFRIRNQTKEVKP